MPFLRRGSSSIYKAVNTQVGRGTLQRNANCLHDGWNPLDLPPETLNLANVCRVLAAIGGTFATYLGKTVLQRLVCVLVTQESADMYPKMVKAAIKLDAASSNFVTNCCGEGLVLDDTAAIFDIMLEARLSTEHNQHVQANDRPIRHTRISSKGKPRTKELLMSVSFGTLVNAYSKVGTFSKRKKLVVNADVGVSNGCGKTSKFSNVEDVVDCMERAVCEKDRSI